MPPKAQKKQSSEMLPLTAVLGLALQLGFAVSAVSVLSIWGGHYIDAHYATAPYGFWIGVIAGLGGGLSLVWQIVQPIRERANYDDTPTKKRRMKK